MGLPRWKRFVPSPFTVYKKLLRTFLVLSSFFHIPVHGAVADEKIPVLFRALTDIPSGVRLIICAIHLYDIPGVQASARGPANVVTVQAKGTAQLFEQQHIVKANALL